MNGICYFRWNWIIHEVTAQSFTSLVISIPFSIEFGTHWIETHSNSHQMTQLLSKLKMGNVKNDVRRKRHCHCENHGEKHYFELRSSWIRLKIYYNLKRKIPILISLYEKVSSSQAFSMLSTYCKPARTLSLRNVMSVLL